MARKDRLSGNEAIAYAMTQTNIDVVAAFPITPSTEIPEYFSQYVANGDVNTVFVPVESEHSAMSACVGAEIAGARSSTASSSCGIALMYEMLHVASALRAPIVMSCVTRALTGPINIHNDHGDAMGSRDCGWVQIYAENAQEAYDQYILSFVLGEDKRVRLPVMACQDGFITSHAVENIEIMDDDVIKKFVGFYEPEDYMLNPEMPKAFGPYDSPVYLMEHKRQQAQAMIDAKDVFLEVTERFAEISGRKYDVIEEYRTEDAERVLILLGSSAGTAKTVVDALREKGEKVGLIKITLYRPFPGKEIAAALSKVKAAAIMDKAEALSGIGGPLFMDASAALINEPVRPLMVNYMYGLGGRDVRPEHIEKVFSDLSDDLEKGKVENSYRYLALRE